MIAASDEYLHGRLDRLRIRVRDAVAQRRVGDPDPEDRFRGLYISDAQADATTDEIEPMIGPVEFDDELEARADALEQEGEDLHLRNVARSFGLTSTETEILVVAAAPDLDPRFERAYGYLHDDVTRRRASVGLAIELCGGSPLNPHDRNLLAPMSRLVRFGLIVVEETDRPLLSRSLRVPDVVVDHLLTGKGVDPIVETLRLTAVTAPEIDAEVVARALRFRCDLIYIRDHLGAAPLAFAVGGVLASGRDALIVDFERLPNSPDLPALALAITRAARLDGAVLVAGPVEALGERDAAAVRAFADADMDLILIGSLAWDPMWSRRPPLQLDPPDIGHDFAVGLPFRLTPEQAAKARASAELHATAFGEPVTLEHLAAGARAQNASGLERLALRISPVAGFDDLVLPEVIVQQLRDIVARVRYRNQVLGDWGMQRSGAKGRGVTALFAGDSGTGKTLAAEVVAGALGLDLYVIDLATVIDKYIGETEKNLDRIFREADRVNGVLLFDEADAIFGKRSEVHDARDRYANVEVAYLLQRMERFDGIAVLTTNLRANLDDAFLRRLDALVDFPTPDEPSRRLLWERHLPPTLPRAASVDVGFLARSFDLSGGNIRNIAVGAAFLAAANEEPLAMANLIKATAREYRKLGRLCVEAEFGPYFEIV
jgi:ATPase family associated with various cellular activities (AAA)